MFFLGIKGRKLTLLRKFAVEKNLEPKEAGQLVLLKGLQLLRSAGPAVNTVKLLTAFQVKTAKLHTLIRKHYPTKGEAEIGRLMDPPVSAPAVRYHRLKLGLHTAERHDSARKGATREIVESGCEEFKQMLNHDGYTLTEYIRFKNLHCTKQYLGQVAEIAGLKHSLLDRVPEWGVRRKARKLGNPNLANKEWLDERLQKVQSIATLAADLEVEERNLYFFIRRHGLTHPQIRKHGTMVVDLICAYEPCGKPFKRLKRLVDSAVKAGRGKAVVHYCSMACVGGSKRKAIEERHALFIHKHYKEESDEWTGKALGISRHVVRRIRVARGWEKE